MAVSFDILRIHTILADFYEITGFRIGIFDAQFQRVIEYPAVHCAFCSLVRHSPGGLIACRQCDLTHSRAVLGNGELAIYLCHAGLTEAIAPLLDNGKPVGYLMIGQIRDAEPSPAALHSIVQAAAAFGVDKQTLLRAYSSAVPATRLAVVSAAHLMQICASYLWLEKLVAVDHKLLHEKLLDYIDAHYAQTLDIPGLCTALGVGKTTLCQAARENLGASVGKLILTRRIKAARELLDTTTLSIAQVAAAVGIPDYNYFSKVFRRAMGLSPRIYRQDRNKKSP